MTNLESLFELRIQRILGMVDGMAQRLETESWHFIPEQLKTAKHELTTLVDMWAEIKAKPESEGDKCQSK